MSAYEEVMRRWPPLPEDFDGEELDEEPFDREIWVNACMEVTRDYNQDRSPTNLQRVQNMADVDGVSPNTVLSIGQCELNKPRNAG